MMSFSDRDAISLVNALEKLERGVSELRGEIGTLRNTLTVNTQQMIEFRNDFNDSTQEARTYRAVRATAELEELENRRHSAEVRIQTLKGNGTTSEKIQAAVQKEIKKNSVDWRQVLQVAVQAVVGSLAVGVIGILFWQVIKILAANAP